MPPNLTISVVLLVGIERTGDLGPGCRLPRDWGSGRTKIRHPKNWNERAES